MHYLPFMGGVIHRHYLRQTYLVAIRDTKRIWTSTSLRQRLISFRQSPTSDVKIDLVIKLGGSSITVKERFETLKPESLKTAAKLIKACVENGVSCVVVHGAGSFGHHQAKQYKVDSGWKHLTDKHEIGEVKRGMCLVRQSVRKLHQHVMAALLGEELPAIGISVMKNAQQSLGVWESIDKTHTMYDITTATSLLSEGFVPVFYGDIILDQSLGCVVLSGDTIIQTVCRDCYVNRVVFLTGVDGVFDKPPLDNPDAKLQRDILVKKESPYSGLKGIVTNSDDHDVTGGMTLKLQTAINIVKNSAGKTSVYVCKVGSPFSVEVCCTGKVREGGATGTVIKYVTT